MINVITAPEGKVYRNKISGMWAKNLILGITDNIDNYELIEEPIIEEVIEDVDSISV